MADHIGRVRWNKEFFKILEATKVDLVSSSESYHNILLADGTSKQFHVVLEIIHGLKDEVGMVLYLKNDGKQIYFFSEHFSLIKKRTEQYHSQWSVEAGIIHELLYHYVYPDYLGSVVEERCCDKRLCDMANDDFFNFKDRIVGNSKKDNLIMGHFIFKHQL